MWHEQSHGSSGSLLHHLRRLAVAAFGFRSAGASIAVPQEVGFPLIQSSDEGHFRLRISSDADPVPKDRSHTWTLQVMDSEGSPVEHVVILVTDRMPEDRHGLATQLRVTPTPSPGVYRLWEVGRSMTAWRIVNVALRTPCGRADTLTLKLKP